MKTFLNATLAIMVLMTGTTVFASDAYIVGNLNITNSTVNTDGTTVLDSMPHPAAHHPNANFSDTLNNSLTGGVGVGMDINHWLAIEATADWLGKGASVDNFTYNTRSFTGWIVVDPTVTTIYNMPLKTTARIGYSASKLYIGPEHCSDNQFAYGAGLALGVTNNTDIILDYRLRTINADGIKVDFNTITLGAKYSF